jgi:DNA replication ATP-dependent helicase Dna2
MLRLGAKAAKRVGYEVSLFKTLSEAHPEAITELALQYRMNEDIMTISNRLIYSNKLRCGSEVVATRGMTIPNSIALTKVHTRSCQTECWIDRLLLERYAGVS